MEIPIVNVLPGSDNLIEQADLLPTTAPSDNTANGVTLAASPTAISRTKAKLERRAAKAALHNAQQGHDDSKEARRKTRYATGQSSLLRLPAELRNNIYRHALTLSTRYALKGLRVLPLLQVCKQIRSEATGLLTAVNDIDLIVRSNYVVLSRMGVPISNQYFHHDIGLLLLDRQRGEWIDKTNQVFRNIRVVVHCACYLHRCNCAVGEFVISVVDGSYSVKSQVWYWFKQPKLPKIFREIEADVREVLKKAEARVGFAGLKLSDLENLAKCFDWVEIVHSDGE